MTFSVSEGGEILERTPAVLTAWLGGLSDAWLRADEGPDTFSPHDVVAHLVQGEVEDWVPRMRIILEEGELRSFTPFERFAFHELYAGQSTAELLERFEALRRENVAALKAVDLTPETLAKTGTHPELGRVTLSELLSTWVVHDVTHLAQIGRVMAKHFGGGVGPWKAYMPILNR